MHPQSQSANHAALLSGKAGTSDNPQKEKGAGDNRRLFE
jgi:hypothetical protein